MQELARRGLLPRPRLLLAAYLGSSGALALLGDAGFPAEEKLLTWLRGLGKGRLARRERLARAAIARAGFAIVERLDEEGLADAETLRLARFLAEERPSELAPLQAPFKLPHPSRRSALLSELLATGQGSPLKRASALARLADEAAARLSARHRNNRQLLRQAIQDTLLAWLFSGQAEPE